MTIDDFHPHDVDTRDFLECLDDDDKVGTKDIPVAADMYLSEDSGGGECAMLAIATDASSAQHVGTIPSLTKAVFFSTLAVAVRSNASTIHDNYGHYYHKKTGKVVQMYRRHL